MRVSDFIKILQQMEKQHPGCMVGARIGTTDNFSPTMTILLAKTEYGVIGQIEGIRPEDVEAQKKEYEAEGIPVVSPRDPNPNYQFKGDIH